MPATALLPTEPLRILHVDDDPAATRLVSTKLGAHGIEVTPLHDPTRAVECILRGNFRIVLLDVDMPVLDGIELLQQIKHADGGTAVIMLTGVVSMSSVLRAMRKGASACLFKPLTDDSKLLECIDEISRNMNRWWDTLQTLSDLRKN